MGSRFFSSLWLLLMALSLSGCAPALTALGSAAGLGVVGVKYLMGGTVERTFWAPLSGVQEAARQALREMEIPLQRERVIPGGAELTGAVPDLDVTVALASITSRVTRVSVKAGYGLYKDRATAVAIIDQLAMNLTSATDAHTEIDTKSDHTLEDLSGVQDPLVPEKAPHYEQGKVLAVSEDRSVRAIAVPDGNIAGRPLKTVPPSGDPSGSSKSPPAEDHYNKGNALAEQEKWAEAETAYREAVRLDPKIALYHFSLGNALGRQGKWQEAEGSYTNAVWLDPKHARAYVGLGDVYSAQKKWPEAEAMYRRAIQLEPRTGSFYADLARALLQQNRRAEALQATQEAIRLGFKFRGLGLNP